MLYQIKNTIKKLYSNSIFRYIFFGGLTTLVNLISYSFLRNIINFNTANIISIIIAILFAYFVNSRYVFQSVASNYKEKTEEFMKFIGARISTMVIEVVGVYLLVNLLKINDMYGKIIIQFVVLVLNYIFSKLMVFKNK